MPAERSSSVVTFCDESSMSLELRMPTFAACFVDGLGEQLLGRNAESAPRKLGLPPDGHRLLPVPSRHWSSSSAYARLIVMGR